MKNGANKKNRDFKFIDNEDFQNHLLMLYENAESGFVAKVRFLNNGMLKGEHAVFLTSEDPKYIEGKISKIIDLNKFRKKGLLHIVQIPENFTNSSDALKQYEKVLKVIESSAEKGFRLTGPFIEETNNKMGKKLRLLVEQKSEKFLSKHKGSILCPLPIVKAKNDEEKKWMCNMLRKHTDVLYIPNSGQSRSFNSDFVL
jgi:hypothetical protein